MIDANGWGRLRPLTTFEASEPAWSPDGKQIAFERDRDIYVMNADGTEPTNLTNTSEDEASPSWSPDGSEIAFIRSGESYNNGVYNYSTDLYKIDADGSGDTRLIQDDVGGYPTWSPDGTKIAFMRGGTAIYTIDSDGSNLTLVRRFPGHPVGPLNWR